MCCKVPSIQKKWKKFNAVELIFCKKKSNHASLKNVKRVIEDTGGGGGGGTKQLHT